MNLAIGVEDLRRGFKFLPLSLQMAASEVRMRYVRSVFGPLWITSSMLAFSFAIGLVMSGLFGAPLRHVLPFVMVGITLWTFIGQSAMEACTALTASRTHLLGAPLPYASFAHAVLIRNFIFLLHHLGAYLILALVLQVWPNPGWLLAIPGLALMLLATWGMVLFLAALTPRFRDIGPLVGMLVGVGALLTPVYWRPDLLVKNAFVATINPFTHLLAVVRQPLINEPSTVQNWVVALLFSLACAVIGAASFVSARKRLPFWI